MELIAPFCSIQRALVYAHGITSVEISAGGVVAAGLEKETAI